MKSAFLKCLLFTACFFIAASGWAQVKKVSGKVTDESNNPLSGVSIIIQGKTEGTQTIADGTYSIDVTPGDVLNFSFVGYSSQKVKVENSAIINMTLNFSQSRRNVTTSISKLDNNVLSSTPRANIGSALQGTISGLQVVNATGQPGASPVIILRGGASINNPGGPLVGHLWCAGK